MIDTADKQTQPLPLDEQPAKRKRGRPATGAAMTAAEKQRAYRERQKAKSSQEDPAMAEEIKRMQAEIARLKDALVATDAAGIKRIDELRTENEKLKKQLSSRDDKPVKGLSYRKLTEYTLDQLKDNEKRAKPEMAKEWSFGAYMLWQSLAVTMNVQKAALEADMAKMRGMAGLEPKVPK